jgi:hypothetical protein
MCSVIFSAALFLNKRPNFFTLTIIYSYKSFLRFFFDYADKDKSQTLDINELNNLFAKFPLIFKKNQLVKNLVRKLEKNKLKVLTKSEFISVIEESKRDKSDNVEFDLINKKIMDSVILEYDKQYRDLMSLCQMDGQKWRLLYRATRDGFGSADFHRKCDDKPNTLTIIKAMNSTIFGGLTYKSWSSCEKFKSDFNALVFSLINDQNISILYECSKPENGIYCSKEMGPCFGKNDLYIYNCSNLNTKSRSCIGTSYNSSNKDSTSIKFLAGSEYFKTVEIEVFTKDYKALSKVKYRCIE